MAEGKMKYEAFKVSYTVMKDTGGSSSATNHMTVLMDSQSADATRAIDEVRKHLLKQGHLQGSGDPVDVVSARRLKVFEAVKLADLGETIIVD
jgi:hypothetical protein